jgi:acyl carrier protein
MNTLEVRARVERVLREILHVEPAEPIDDATTLFADLGVASVDLVNIHFRLEHEFGTPIGPGDLWRQGLDLIQRRLVRGSRLTPAGAAEVRRRLPRAALARGREDLALYDIFPAITVGDVVEFFARRTAASAPHGSAS